MTFTKKKMAAVISGSLLMGLASSAGAVNLDNNLDTNTANDDDVEVASELNVASTGTALTGAFLNATFVLNPSVIPANSDVRVKLDLGGTATFSGTAPSGSAGNPFTFGVIDGGLTENTITLNANVGTADISAGQAVTFVIPQITVTDQSAVSMTATISRADNFGSATIKTLANSPYVSFADSFAVTYTPNASVRKIDVTNSSILFADSAGNTANTAQPGSVTVTYTAKNDFTGTTIAGSTITNAIAVTLTGDNGLDAFATSNTGAGVVHGLIPLVVSGNSAAATGQTFAAVATGAAQNVVMTVPAANTIAIQETPISVTYAGTPSVPATYNTDSLDGTGSLSALDKNGSSARLNFALKPGGNFTNYIRITNPSGIDGDVFLTLTNDDGTSSAQVGLGTITGAANDNLAAGASTALLDITDVFAAVQGADSTFDLGTNSTRLRVDVEAEFGTDDTVVAGNAALVVAAPNVTGPINLTSRPNTTSVLLQAFSISNDGNSFNMMTDASK